MVTISEARLFLNLEVIDGGIGEGPTATSGQGCACEDKEILLTEHLDLFLSICPRLSVQNPFVCPVMISMICEHLINKDHHHHHHHHHHHRRRHHQGTLSESPQER